MKNKETLLLLGLGLAVWYLRARAASMPTTTAAVDRNPMGGRYTRLPQSPSPYAIAREKQLSGYEKVLQRQVS